MKIPGSNIKKFFIFQETETTKKISYTLGNGIFLYFQKWNFPSSKNKKNRLLKGFLSFGKWNLLAANLRNFLYFKRNLQGLKKTKNICSEEIFCPLRCF